MVKSDGSAAVIQDYADKYLMRYAMGGDGFTALVLNDYMIGDQGNIMTVDHSGKVLGTLNTDRKILSVSVKDKYLSVLYSDALVIYDKTLKECAHFNDIIGAEETIMRSDGKAFAITSHSAAVCPIKP
jgi:hypothetical protein